MSEKNFEYRSTRREITVPSQILQSEFWERNNQFVINGIIDAEFENSSLDKDYYQTKVRTERFSGKLDYVVILISKELKNSFDCTKFAGKYIEAIGKIETINNHDENYVSHLHVFMKVKDAKISNLPIILESDLMNNLVYFEGYLCKMPKFRVTPLGRFITDLFIAVNNDYGSSNYIPCIAWGGRAFYTSELEIGDKVTVSGRLQSRQYLKKFSLDSEEGEIRETYEVSITQIMKIDSLSR